MLVADIGLYNRTKQGFYANFEIGNVERMRKTRGKTQHIRSWSGFVLQLHENMVSTRCK